MIAAGAVYRQNERLGQQPPREADPAPVPYSPQRDPGSLRRAYFQILAENVVQEAR
jgi:hypothetical protein